METSPRMQEILDHYDRLGVTPLHTVSAEIARQLPNLQDAVLDVLSHHITKRVSGPLEQVGSVEHRVITGPGGDLLLRIYNPRGEGPFPILVYFHGGGWVVGSLDSYDSSCRALCNAADHIVISVAYRQAPEHKFPAAIEDAYAAYQWAVHNAEELNGDANCVAVAGESAGGNLAAVVCLMARDRNFRSPIHQVLIYPVVHFDFESDSYHQHANAKPLNKAMMQWFWEHYLEAESDGTSLYASPLLADLQNLPAATVITAGIDPLRSEGEAYAKKLAASGVDVSYKCFENLTHEFFGMGSLVPEAKKALSLVAENLQAASEDESERYIRSLQIDENTDIVRSDSFQP